VHKKNIVYIGLGSNIEQPYQQIKKAIVALEAVPEASVLGDSGYFKSRPMGPKDQPDYVNAVVKIETTIHAEDLLAHCQQIEKQQGRVKHRHWGERSIDLDILLYGDQKIQTADLTVPHPGVCLRDFVFLPLLKLNADVVIPDKGLLSEILEIKTINKPALKKYKTDYDCQFAGNIER